MALDKVRNIIEKGKLLEELTQVQTTAWDKKVAKPNVITGKKVDIRPIGAPAKPKKADLGRERRWQTNLIMLKLLIQKD